MVTNTASHRFESSNLHNQTKTAATRAAISVWRSRGRWLLTQRYARTLPFESPFQQVENDRAQMPGRLLLAEEGRFELPRQLSPTYRFSKPAPSTTWVLLHTL